MSYLPGAQYVQLADPTAECCPLAHAVQLDESSSARVEKVPAGQGAHLSAAPREPSTRALPGKQASPGVGRKVGAGAVAAVVIAFAFAFVFALSLRHD